MALDPSFILYFSISIVPSRNILQLCQIMSWNSSTAKLSLLITKLRKKVMLKALYWCCITHLLPFLRSGSEIIILFQMKKELLLCAAFCLESWYFLFRWGFSFKFFKIFKCCMLILMMEMNWKSFLDWLSLTIMGSQLTQN